MKYHLSKMEQEIMDLLWERRKWMAGAGVWEYLNENGRECKRTTVNTYLTRMTEKGLLVKDGTKYIYRYNREEFENKQANEILEGFFGGSLARFLAALSGGKGIGEKEAEELKDYLNRQE